MLAVLALGHALILVVGILEELGVRTPHVVALHKRFLGHLPVALDVDDLAPVKAHQVHAQHIEVLRCRLDKFLERLRLHTHIDKHKSRPAAHMDARHGHVLAAHIGAALPLFLVEDTGVVAVQIPLPGVENTMELVDLARAAEQSPPAVRADIVERLNHVLAAVHQHHRLVADVVHQVITHPWQLLLTTGPVPGAGPQAFHFEAGKFR